MSCKSVRSRLSAYVDDALPAEEREGIERHLADCAECASELRSFAVPSQVLRSMAAARPSEGLADRAWRAAVQQPRPTSLLDRFVPVAVRAVLVTGAVTAAAWLMVWIAVPRTETPDLAVLEGVDATLAVWELPDAQ